MPFTIFSGFFLKLEDSPILFHWVFHISFLKHGLVGLVLSIMGMERPKLKCTDVYCHYTRPRQFLKDYGMLHESFIVVISSLAVIGAVVLSLTYIVLKIRLKLKW